MFLIKPGPSLSPLSLLASWPEVDGNSSGPELNVASEFGHPSHLESAGCQNPEDLTCVKKLLNTETISSTSHLPLLINC